MILLKNLLSLRRLIIKINLLSPGTHVLINGIGITGRVLIKILKTLKVRVTLCDDNYKLLERYTFTNINVISQKKASANVHKYALIITSPGFSPSASILKSAAKSKVPIWSDVELAWQLDISGYYGRAPRKWLIVTGTNGKTTTALLLQSMLLANGLKSQICGNIGRPVLSVLNQSVDFLVVELSSFQLHWTYSIQPQAGLILNISEDHLDWHSSMMCYAADKIKVLDGKVAIVILENEITAKLLSISQANIRIGCQLSKPKKGELGISSRKIIDKAFCNNLKIIDTNLIKLTGTAGLLNALAATALARSIGVSSESISSALISFKKTRHRVELICEFNHVQYFNDSKATNPHAAQTSIRMFKSVVWIAGGLLKNTLVDKLIFNVCSYISGVILIGKDSSGFLKSLSKHAPNIPIILIITEKNFSISKEVELSGNSVSYIDKKLETSISDAVMLSVVKSANKLTSEGDVVLLAPAAASLDQFNNYAHRGDAFAKAVYSTFR